MKLAGLVSGGGSGVLRGGGGGGGSGVLWGGGVEGKVLMTGGVEAIPNHEIIT